MNILRKERLGLGKKENDWIQKIEVAQEITDSLVFTCTIKYPDGTEASFDYQYYPWLHLPTLDAQNFKDYHAGATDIELSEGEGETGTGTLPILIPVVNPIPIPIQIPTPTPVPILAF